MKRLCLALLIFFAASLFLFIACSSSGGDDDPIVQTCNQHTDCGNGEGRVMWECYDSICYLQEDFCMEDAECVNGCVNHQCVGGKATDEPDGDENVTDGDEDVDEGGQVPCEYECCTVEDCPENNYCDENTHTCVVIVDCPPEYECCQDQDCWNNAAYGLDYVCYMNECGHKDHPCNYECCTQEDCSGLGEGYICADHVCKKDVIECTPGDKTCCENDPGNPDCLELGALFGEGILTCNATGDGYELSMCDPFNDCLAPGFDGPGTVDCLPNGRCELDADCDCPKICFETANQGKKCMVPKAENGELCASDKCEAGQVELIASCPAEHVCCIGIDQNNADYGYCTPEAECAK